MRKFIILAALAVSTLSAVAGPFEDGASAYKRGDYSTAINRWRPLAASDPTIQNNYGIMYKDGKGVKRDYGMAATWFSRSASACFPMARWICSGRSTLLSSTADT